MITQTIVLWTLGGVLSLCIVIGTGLAGLVGTLLLMLYKNFSARIERNEKSLERLTESLDEKITSNNNKILDAIKEASKTTVHVNDCNSNIRLIEQSAKFSAEDSKKEHKLLGKTLAGILDQLGDVISCLHNIQKKQECKI